MRFFSRKRLGLIIIATALVTFSFAFQAAANGEPIPCVVDDGLMAEERTEIYGDVNGSRGRGTEQDIIIVHEYEPRAFFGLYRASQMTAPGWDLFERSVDWVTGFSAPESTTVWLATYNGTLDPQYSAELDGIAIHDYLITTMGFLEANIHVDHQSTIETADFTGYDVVMYAWIYPRDATNVMNQDKPFLTVCAAETDEMEIGTGLETMHEFRDYGYIVNNNHSITQTYGLGPFTLASGMFIDATVVAGHGNILASAEPRGLTLGVEGECPGTVTATVNNANTGDRIYFIYGVTEGAGPGVPGCPGVNVDILSPNIVGMDVADADGQATLSGTVPPAGCGVVKLQAVNLDDCTVSNVIDL